MIEFDEVFFEDEIRDGHFVRSEMKRRWAAEMEVLKEIDRICKKRNITYYADSGTLLGAVRHNGFIPWDDDMDIVMFRSDYMKFLSVLKEELSPPFIGLNIYHYKDFDRLFVSVQNGLGISFNEDFLNRFHGCPHGTGVDIFCLDNMWQSEDEFYEVMHVIDFVSVVNKVLEMRKEEETFGEISEDEHWLNIKKEIDCFSSESLLRKVEDMCNVSIQRNKNIKNQLLRILDGLFSLCGDEESELVVNMTFAAGSEYHHAGFKREWYRGVIELPFENICIPVPVDYRKVLERMYGIRYLLPVKYSHEVDNHMRKEVQKAKRFINVGN